MAQVASELLEKPDSLHSECVKNAMSAAEDKTFDHFFAFLEVSMCPNCGTHVAREEQDDCPKCGTSLWVAPPLRLLKCLTRLSIHFQHNFEAPQSVEFDLFIRYLVSLQSKLFRMQETPTNRERAYLVDSMRKLDRFTVVNGLGNIIMNNPNEIRYELPPDLPTEKTNLAHVVLPDFTATLQFLSNWMSKTRALS